MIGDTYSVGKAGLNMAVRKYGAALKASGSPILLINVYPGMFILFPTSLSCHGRLTFSTGAAL
jgi:hypothetical protein